MVHTSSVDLFAIQLLQKCICVFIISAYRFVITSHVCVCQQNISWTITQIIMKLSESDQCMHLYKWSPSEVSPIQADHHSWLNLKIQHDPFWRLWAKAWCANMGVIPIAYYNHVTLCKIFAQILTFRKQSFNIQLQSISFWSHSRQAICISSRNASNCFLLFHLLYCIVVSYCIVLNCFNLHYS